ncbi:MAG: DUF11 domain-containing protein, partial [Micrococcales bacterium]|nr:DUF11 domain-containing protein [Micrococcales bacterium]
MTKTATPSVVSAPSEISYTFTVANTGDVTVNDLTIDDPKLGGTVPGCATTLTVDHSTTCSGTYSVTQDDIDSGTNIVNQATASGTSSEGSVTSSDSATVTVLQNPKIQLTKLASVSSVSAPGNVTYRLTVQNTGNVTVNNVGVTDPLLSGLISCSPTTLAPDSTGGTDGATATCTMVDPTDSSKTVAPWYSVTQRDIDTMTSIDNEATATAIAANGVDLKSMAKATVPVDQTPGLTLMKSASPSSVAAAGDVVTYSFVLANTGNVTLTDVAVTDRMLSDAGVPVMFNDAAGVPVPCELTLAPGDSETCTAEYPVTAVDIAAGGISNTATASGTEPDDTVYTTPDASTANVSVTVTPPANGGGSTPPPANGGGSTP